MAKRQALLFELMREDETPPKKKGLWDHLFRRPATETPDQAESAAPATEPPPAELTTPAPATQPAAETPATTFVPAEEGAYPQPQIAPASPIPAMAPSDEEEAGRTRVFLRINTFSIVLGSAVVLVVFFCGYILGHQIGWQSGVKERSTSQFGTVTSREPNEGVLEVKEKAQLDTHTVVRTPERTEAPPAKDILPNEGKSTRKGGFNYLIIQYFEETADAERAKAFLAEKEIGTTIEREGRLYALVSTTPFKSNKEPAAVQYQAQIRACGQQYRRQKEALGVDFQTCFYKKWK